MIVAGLCIVAFSLAIVVVMFRNLYLLENNFYYRMSNGLSEEGVAIIAIVFSLLTILGLVLMFFGWLKRRNKVVLDSIMNSTTEKFCRQCNVNVSKDSEYCPICGRKL